MEVKEATAEESLDLLDCRNQAGRTLKKRKLDRIFAQMEETCPNPKEVRSGIVAEHTVYQIRVNGNGIWLDRRVEDEFGQEMSPEWEELGKHARITAGLILIDDRLDSHLIKNLIEKFSLNEAKAARLHCFGPITCSPVELENLLQLLGVTSIDCHQLDNAFFTLPTFQNLDLKIMKCDFDDEQLLRLGSERIFLRNANITPEGINQFIQQWKKGERKIQSFELEFDDGIGNFAVILAGLDANPIWTPDLHEFSIANHIPLAQFPEMLMGDPEHYFSLWRPENISDILIVRLERTRVDIRPGESEVEVLTGAMGDYYVRKRWNMPVELGNFNPMESLDLEVDEEDDDDIWRPRLDHDLLVIPPY